jgi:hypothetical protein
MTEGKIKLSSRPAGGAAKLKKMDAKPQNNKSIRVIINSI